MKKSSKQRQHSKHSPAVYIFTVRVENGKPVETIHSETCLDVTGYTNLEFEIDSYLWISMVHEEDRDIVRKHAEQVCSGNSPGPIQHRIIHKNGSVRLVENSIFLNHNSDGMLTSYNGVIRDVSESDQPTNYLAEETVHIKQSHASADNIIYDYHVKSRTVQWYGDIDSCLGYARGKFQNTIQAWADIIHPDDLETVMMHYKQCSETGEDAQFQYRIRRPDGTFRHLEEHAIPIFSQDNRIIKWIGTIRDYTHRKETAKALKDSENKYHTLFENATDAIYLIDPATQKILDCNIKATQLIGYTKKQIKGMKIGELHPVEEQDIVSKIFSKIMGEGQLSGIAGINQLKIDGDLVPVEINAATIEIDGQKYCLGIFRDVTERTKSEEYLRYEKDKLISILDAMDDGVYIVNDDYDIEYLNPVLRKSFGAINGNKCYKFFHNKKTICPWCKNREVLTGKTVHWEWTSSKDRKTYDLIEAPLKNPDGSISKMVTLRDITERKCMEEELQKASITDNLTGLLNRRGFFTIAGQQWRLADRNKRRMSLFYFDMDDIKGINDKFGYKAGDQSLVDIANILKKSFRKSDVISRISSDEFAILISDNYEHDIESIINSNVIKNLEAHNKKNNLLYKLSLSTGLAHYDPGKSCSVDELLTHADAAMHKNKMYKQENTKISALKKKTAEERIHKRYEASDTYTAELAVQDTVSIKNMSKGGMCLMTSQYLNTRNKYRISMHSENTDKITLTGKVIWSSLLEATDDRDAGAPRYEAGVSFSKLNDNQLRSLNKFIDGLEH